MSRRGLIGGLEQEALDVNVPTASEPVPAAAEVTCVHCQRRVALAETDVVGLGYRCRACSDRAELAELRGEGDVSDHLVAGDRARFAEQGKQLALRALAVFALLVACGILMLVVAPSPAAFKLFLTALILLLAVGGHGYSRWRRFRVR